MKDKDFIRGKVPMTKEEVRAIVLSKLELCSSDNFMDIGAGTGSVTIEGALKAYNGKALGIEQNEDAVELIKQNIAKFNIQNLEVIHGKAPLGMDKTAEYNKFFIGGSRGNLTSIIETITQQAPKQHIIVVTAIVLDTMIEAYNHFKNQINYETELVQVAVNRIEPDKKPAMLMANNPIFIITAKSC
ncbi:precorrin-6Y C5,15-methyltransferase (decarboxylating) subunit CbiT [Saccharicrinis aurantiacus]|uniref:precorrin-6Y C5,15-methyltransferase (decarboxylating) subunit CbiT n=1 Tax=Saccharicrinis aurantiacus TaxID=1849719 RepID=UPI002492701A|nr:precorrin-6Y C5,15-methyltransferase (decarboxylating) subunit CbiT [Saccharicrinis aurantiacus]